MTQLVSDGVMSFKPYINNDATSNPLLELLSGQIQPSRGAAGQFRGHAALSLLSFATPISPVAGAYKSCHNLQQPSSRPVDPLQDGEFTYVGEARRPHYVCWFLDIDYISFSDHERRQRSWGGWDRRKALRVRASCAGKPQQTSDERSSARHN